MFNTVGHRNFMMFGKRSFFVMMVTSDTPKITITLNDMKNLKTVMIFSINVAQISCEIHSEKSLQYVGNIVRFLTKKFYEFHDCNTLRRLFYGNTRGKIFFTKDEGVFSNLRYNAINYSCEKCLSLFLNYDNEIFQKIISLAVNVVKNNISYTEYSEKYSKLNDANDHCLHQPDQSNYGTWATTYVSTPSITASTQYYTYTSTESTDAYCGLRYGSPTISATI